MNTVIVGDRGQITIPKQIRKKYGIKKKQPLIIEDKDGEIVIKPAVAVPIKELKKLARKFDDDFIKEITEEDLLKDSEEEKILSKWEK
ncbi:AbrB/MazE/SpoVT family DNA-binding domain-containing protein [Hippea sp. KM1]|uniref:AbrB/MazE/SpoVT family DNA-binding domain-containing protein n=1 Tax=Hippea sp. KM1 TaxID=944481 RepID=UPI00046D0696|nr:AbrB/MazE/SpoVT family DNA-binding domain-containing protein [Hippea sp. KM1]